MPARKMSANTNTKRKAAKQPEDVVADKLARLNIPALTLEKDVVGKVLTFGTGDVGQLGQGMVRKEIVEKVGNLVLYGIYYL